MNRVVIELVTISGRCAAAEFRVRRDTVELWHREHLAAVFDRDVLADWLREPVDDLVSDEARLSVDWLIDVQGRVALTLPDVNAWALSPTELDTLYRRVVADVPLPAPPTWSKTTSPIERGREFSAGFGTRRDGVPHFLVELVQTEVLDDATVHRSQPRVYVVGASHTPAEATEILTLLKAALTALG